MACSVELWEVTDDCWGPQAQSVAPLMWTHQLGKRHGLLLQFRVTSLCFKERVLSVEKQRESPLSVEFARAQVASQW